MPPSSTRAALTLGALTLLCPACFNPSPPADTDATFGTSSPTPVTDSTDSTSGSGPTDGSATSSPTDTEGPGTSSSGDPDPDSSSDTTGAATHTIYEIQDGTLAAGASVDVREVVVTAVAMDGMFVQDPSGGAHSGIFVVTGMPPAVSRGDEVDVTGTIVEPMGETRIDATAGTVVPTGGAGIELSPRLLPAADLSPETSEPWEGVVVRVEGAPLSVTEVPAVGFRVTSGEDPVDVGRRLFDVASAPMVFPSFGPLASFSAIQGPLGDGAGGRRILPREAIDLEGYAPPLLPEPHPFPSAGDTSFFMSGSLPWNDGDFFEGVRMTALPGVDAVDVHVDVITNGLSECGFQTADVIIDGITVGDFTIEQGTVAIDQSYPLPMEIGGPAITIRYETTTTVASGCGAAGYSQMTSTITFVP